MWRHSWDNWNIKNFGHFVRCNCTQTKKQSDLLKSDPSSFATCLLSLLWALYMWRDWWGSLFVSLWYVFNYCIGDIIRKTEERGNIVVVQLLKHLQIFLTPWTSAFQAFLSFTNPWSWLKLMSIESVIPPNHLISVMPFSSCFQSFPASGSFPVLIGSSHQVAKVLELQHQCRSFQWIFRVDFLCCCCC